MPPDVARFILTVHVREQADEVQETLLEVAEHLNGRLTRYDHEPTGEQDARGRDYYRQTKGKTLRKLGFLA